MWLSIHSSFRSSNAIQHTNRIPHLSWEIFKCIKDIAFRSRFAWWQNRVTPQDRPDWVPRKHHVIPYFAIFWKCLRCLFISVIWYFRLWYLLASISWRVSGRKSSDFTDCILKAWNCMSCDCIWIYTSFTFKFRDGSWNVGIKSPDQNDRATVQTTFFGRPAHKVRKMCSRMLFKISFCRTRISGKSPLTSLHNILPTWNTLLYLRFSAVNCDWKSFRIYGENSKFKVIW